MRIPCLARKSNGYFDLFSSSAEERGVEIVQLDDEFLFPARHPVGAQPQLADFSGRIQHHQPSANRRQGYSGERIRDHGDGPVSALSAKVIAESAYVTTGMDPYPRMLSNR